jgi:threonine-phosphate decarboxylase
MIKGHGDDAYHFERPMVANFSSNVYSHVDMEPLKEHLRQRLDSVGHYPEPEPYTLERALAGRLGIHAASVCVTNGATEAIYLTAHAFQDRHSTILAPTFSEYADACRLYAHYTPLEKPAKRSEMPDQVLHDVLWLCNPNNPTGGVIPKEQLVKAIEENPETMFVIDQSYGFFTKEELLTAAEAVRYPNVIQLHSMTKRYALPGLRLGYVTANPTLIERIRAVRMPWSVNALAIEAGLYLCEHPETGPIDLEALLAETQRLRKALNAIPGLTAEPTQTHFFLCHLQKGRAADLKRWLAKKHGILIRDASNFEGLDAGHFRIAAQTSEENDLLTAAVQQYPEEHR